VSSNVTDVSFFRCNCVVANTRSLVNKFCEFRMFLDNDRPDIVAITETWLNKDIPSTLFTDLNVYTCYRKDRFSRGGGVCLLIKKIPNLTVTQVVLPDKYSELELLSIDICACKDVLPFRIVVAYRPPDYSSDQNDLLISALQFIANDNGRLCLIGDLNLPAFNWDYFQYPSAKLYNSFADFICSEGLTQLVEEPTRGDSILDLILCNDALCCDEVEVLPPISTSDHNTVSFKLSLSLPPQKQSCCVSTRRNFSKANWPGLQWFLHSVDWHLVCANCRDPTEIWDNFLTIVQDAIDQFVPTFNLTKHTSAPKLYPRAIRKLLSVKRAVWKRLHKFRTPELRAKYKQIAKKVSVELRKNTAAIENKLCEYGNLGKFYKYVNKKLNGSSGIAPLKDKSGNLITDDQDKAELINAYFCSVFIQDNGVIDEKWKIPKRCTKMSPVFVTPSMVQKFIRKLSSNGGAGPDEIPSEFYKNCSDSICLPLSMLFNVSLQTGLLPPIWKSAIVTPVFKKGAPSDPANYRPISLTCIACKLLESCIKEGLLSYLASHDIITKHQHGFLNKKSTTTQLLECSLDWAIAFNSKKPVDIVYLDYAKAFDTVVHSKLLYKLSCYGVCDMVLSWVRNFLSCRLQAVRVGNCVSLYAAVVSGVPQGSVLGPVLFIIFVNDIVTCTNGSVKVKLFADDTKVYSVIDDNLSSVMLQSVLDNIVQWSNHWQLQLSPNKCSAMRMTRSMLSYAVPSDVSYSLCSVAIPSVSSVTDLGVSYDMLCSFRPHINNIVSKASLRAKLILKCFVTRDPSILCKAFCVFVRPLLEFSSAIWNPCFLTDINKIESVQRHFSKRLVGLCKLPYSERLIALGLDSLEYRRLKADLLLCYKIVNNLVDIDKDQFFTPAVGVQGRTRGNSAKLLKRHCSSTRDGHLFHNRVIDAWNCLPDVVVSCPNVHCFKRRLSCINLSKFCMF
jgi:Reverse transcriptase (RNA-dependent DNA polymerase)/Endonuclease-reverse transcriptase